jgi:soluble lytic murein transglycosylase-like protein
MKTKYLMQAGLSIALYLAPQPKLNSSEYIIPMLRAPEAIEKKVEFLWPPALGYVPLPKEQLLNLADNASKKYKVDKVLILAIIQLESWGNPTLRGAKGEIGLMQVKPQFTHYTLKDLEDPQKQVYAGTAILEENIMNFNGDMDKAVMAYNRGPNEIRLNGKDSKIGNRYLRVVKKHMIELKKEMR